MGTSTSVPEATARIVGPARALTDWVVSPFATRALLDAGLVGATLAAILTRGVVLWFHTIFVLLTVAALVLPFRSFVIRLAVWMSVSTALVVWAITSFDTPSEELTELPLLTFVLVLVSMVAHAREDAARRNTEAQAELRRRTDLEHDDLRSQLELSQRRDLIGRTGAGLVHDLRNVFCVIASCLDEMGSARAVRSSQDQGLQAACDEAAIALDRGVGLVDELLWLGKQHDASLEVTDVSTAVSRLEPLLRRLTSRRVMLHLDLPPEPTWIRVDRVGLSQILMNLVSNANDAITGTGHITVAARQTMSVIDGTPTRCLSLIVSDDGRGCSVDGLRRAFDDGFTTKDDTHSGLGLSTVWMIVERCGGAIQIDSSPATGTTVSIRFAVTHPLTDTGRSVESSDNGGAAIPTAPSPPGDRQDTSTSLVQPLRTT